MPPNTGAFDDSFKVGDRTYKYVKHSPSRGYKIAITLSRLGLPALFSVLGDGVKIAAGAIAAGTAGDAVEAVVGAAAKSDVPLDLVGAISALADRLDEDQWFALTLKILANTYVVEGRDDAGNEIRLECGGSVDNFDLAFAGTTFPEQIECVARVVWGNGWTPVPPTLVRLARKARDRIKARKAAAEDKAKDTPPADPVAEA